MEKNSINQEESPLLDRLEWLAAGLDSDGYSRSVSDVREAILELKRLGAERAELLAELRRICVEIGKEMGIAPLRNAVLAKYNNE